MCSIYNYQADIVALRSSWLVRFCDLWIHALVTLASYGVGRLFGWYNTQATAAKRKTLHSQLVWKARAVSRHDSRLAHRLRKHIMVIVTGRLPSLQGMCSVLTNNPYYRWSFYYFDYDFHQSIVPGSAGCAAPGDACALKSALSPIRACAAGARNVANRLRDMTDCQSAAGCSCRCGASRPIFATRPFCSVWGWLAEDAKYAKDE